MTTLQDEVTHLRGQVRALTPPWGATGAGATPFPHQPTSSWATQIGTPVTSQNPFMHMQLATTSAFVPISAAAVTQTAGSMGLAAFGAGAPGGPGGPGGPPGGGPGRPPYPPPPGGGGGGFYPIPSSGTPGGGRPPGGGGGAPPPGPPGGGSGGAAAGQPAGSQPDILNRLVDVLEGKRSHDAGKMERMKIASYDGDIEAFPAWWDSYMAVVGDKKGLSDTEKLWYLKSACKGRALAVIEHLPIQDTQLPEAVKLLKEQFANPRLLLNSISRSIAARPQAESLQQLRDMVYFIAGKVAVMSSLNIAVNNPSASLLLLSICEAKVTWDCLKHWEEEVNRREVSNILKRRNLPPLPMKMYSYPIDTAAASVELFLDFCKKYLLIADATSHKLGGRKSSRKDEGTKGKKDKPSSSPSQEKGDKERKEKSEKGSATNSGQNKKGRKHEKGSKPKGSRNRSGRHGQSAAGGQYGGGTAAAFVAIKQDGYNSSAVDDEEYADMTLLALARNPNKNFFTRGCVFCGENHEYARCPTARSLSIEERWGRIRRHQQKYNIEICFGCLGQHKSSSPDCKAAPCTIKMANGVDCARRHHPLLHRSG